MFVPALVRQFAWYYFGFKRQVAIKQHTVSTSAPTEFHSDLLRFHSRDYTGSYLFGQAKK
jgi:hypothetical protein